MKKLQFTVLLNLKNNYLLICFFIFTSCFISEKEKSYNELNNYFKSEFNISIKNKIHTIYVLTENGCNNCNKSFLHLLIKVQKQDSTLILIVASGSRIDISEINSNSKNVLFSKNSKTEKAYELLEKSKVIYIENNKIDTILTIEAPQLGDQIHEIERRNSTNN